jgi:hypothetical protein
VVRQVGVQVGDDSLTWVDEGEAARVPARVGALVRPTGEVAYLLAGDETGADRHAVQWPRRCGYRWSDAATSGLVLQALLARVKQGLGPGAVPPLAVAVPYWVQGSGMADAAVAVGWGRVTLVTDLFALTWGAVPADVDLLITMVPGSELLDVGAWARGATAWVPLAWESWPRPAIRERLAELLARLRPVRPLAVAGGDLVQAWADQGLDLEVEAAGVGWLNLGPGAVAAAAATWTEARRLDSRGLRVFLEAADGALELRRRGEIWRALTAGGRPAVLRVTAGWGEARALVLWEGTVASPSDPFLARVAWLDPDHGELTVAGPDDTVLVRDQFAFRPR